MAGGKCFSENKPYGSEIVAENRRVAAVDLRRKRGPAQVLFVKVMGVFGCQLHRIPEKGGVLRRPHEGDHTAKEREEAEHVAHRQKDGAKDPFFG